MTTDRYDVNNEAYVFSPQGDKKREALARVQAAEAQCRLDEGLDTTPERPR